MVVHDQSSKWAQLAISDHPPPFLPSTTNPHVLLFMLMPGKLTPHAAAGDMPVGEC